MKTDFGQFTTHITAKNSLEDLLSELNECESVLVGADAEYPALFDCVSIVDKQSGRTFAIGVCSERHGIEPLVRLESEHGLVLIGHDTEIVGVDAYKREAIFSINFSSCFYDFCSLRNETPAVLVVHELGLVAIELTGHVKWKYNTDDVITGWDIDGDRLSMSLMGGGQPVIDLNTGTDIAA